MQCRRLSVLSSAFERTSTTDLDITTLEIENPHKRKLASLAAEVTSKS